MRNQTYVDSLMFPGFMEFITYKCLSPLSCHLGVEALLQYLGDQMLISTHYPGVEVQSHCKVTEQRQNESV